jgi:16S rRNA (guanine527-N7)-methyltransferase
MQSDVSRETFLATLGDGLAELGRPFSSSVLSQSADLYALLLQWNRTHNLTRITDPAEAAIRHFAESFSLLSVPDAFVGVSRCADIGSGAGFPGLPLAMARPDLSWTLVEKVTKKAAFLTFAAATLGLSNVTVRGDDARRLTEQFDLITFRALSSDTSFIVSLVPLLSPTGRFALYLGPEQSVPGFLSGTEYPFRFGSRSFRIALVRPR